LNRTIVVGAGVIGLATAERLAAAGDRVTVVDRGEVGGGTSRTSFAWLNSNSKVPPSYQRLNVAGVDAYQALVGHPGTEPWLHLDGRIEWAVTPDEKATLAGVVETMRVQDYPVEPITARAARGLEPDLRLPDDASVHLWPTEGFVIPQLLVGWLLDRARSSGVELAPGRQVVAFELDGATVRGVRLADGKSLRADRVVVCAGRWTTDVLQLAGVDVPMLPAEQGSLSMGLLGYSKPVPTRLRRTISTAAMSVRPDGEPGRFVLQGHGLDHLAVPGSSPDPAGSIGVELLARVRRVLDGFDAASLAELRVGYRAVPQDRVSVVGWAPDVDGLYVIATHSGITLALLLGELAASEVVHGRTEAVLADFRPERFSRSLEAAEVDARPVH
jgi:glycine/D-amino acid oxidase-like deaminating enzyme